MKRKILYCEFSLQIEVKNKSKFFQMNWSTHSDVYSFRDDVSLQEAPSTNGEVEGPLHHVGDQWHEDILGFTRL